MKNFLLIIFGIFIAFAFLEITLQLASFVIVKTNKYQVHKKYQNLKTKDSITVMCIGESTTYKKYPVQLEQYLKKNSSKNFNIIDCGMPGTVIENILDKIDYQLETYTPDIVISMMGINNTYFPDTKNKVVYKKYKLKTIELFMLIKKHITNLLIPKVFADNQNNTVYYSKLFERYIASGQEPAELLKLLQENPNDINAFNTLINIYFARAEFPEVKKYAQLYINDTTKPINIDILLELAKAYVALNDFDSFLELSEETINNTSLTKDLRKYFLEMTIPNSINDSDNELIKYYNMLVKNKVNNDIVEKLYKLALYKGLAVNKYDYTITNNATDFEFSDNVKEGYLQFAEKLNEKNIIYICMGYPTMPIEKFENFFNNTNLKNKIFFVSNEYNFNEKLKNVPYYNLFSDNFAGTFGHCTAYGNELIAENAGKVIIDLTK